MRFSGCSGMTRVEYASDASGVYFEERDVCAQYKDRRAAALLEVDGQAGERGEAVKVVHRESSALGAEERLSRMCSGLAGSR